MFTPQQIEEISFNRATFGGYDMQSVDEFLEPLTEDYITLYKENALLKSKMRVLVGKLEEYRQNEASLKEAMTATQKSCDTMIKETEIKCAQMLQDAQDAASEAVRNASETIEQENARVEDARRVAFDKIDFLQAQLRSCLDNLEKIKVANRAADGRERPEMFDVVAVDAMTEGVAEEISQNLEAIVGTTAEEEEPKLEPMHPVSDTTGKFANLQFGRNYDPDNDI